MKVGDFSDPIALAAAPADASRLFVAQRGGVVRMVKDGKVVPAPFADLTAYVRASHEEGLLGMAFPPDYAAGGLVYVFLVKPGGGALQIHELRRSADPDRAVPGPGRLVLSVRHRQAATHNGGQLAFGPDGLLYAATGDGGGANDLEDDAADTTSLLGKILRIDPRSAGARPYTIPRDNPFANEVWAYGLRNPWRFSFDRANGDLVIGDVGQGVKEEIDWAPAADGGGRGVDFGWHCREGSVLTPVNPNDRDSAPLCAVRRRAQAPAVALDHGDPDRVCAVVGGFVVRDPGLPTLAGRYLFGDFCRADLLAVTLGRPGVPAETGLSVTELSSFGEDACGRIYTLSLGGEVRRLQENGVSSACGLGPTPGDARPCRTRTKLAYRGTQATLGGRGRLRLTLRSDAACVATLSADGFRTRALTLAAGASRAVRLTPTRRTLGRLRRAAARHGAVEVTVRILTRDRAGAVRVQRPVVRMRR